MAGILDSVNQRTQLVGQNRLELLLFRLAGRQRFGINVFKVREVLQCPPLTAIPKRNKFVRGIAHIRGQTISVIDLSLATGGRPIENTKDSFIVIAEYNRSVQGFLVNSVERIININWSSIMPPPKGTGPRGSAPSRQKTSPAPASKPTLAHPQNPSTPAQTRQPFPFATKMPSWTGCLQG